MRQFRGLLTSLLVLAMISGSLGQTFAERPIAETTREKEARYSSALESLCKEQVCKFYLENSSKEDSSIDTGSESYLIRANAEDVSLLPNGRGIGIKRATTINLPVGLLDLFNSILTIELAEDMSIERLTGTADIPFSLFGSTDTNAKMNVSIGLELGKTLGTRYRKHTLDILDPTQRYLFFYAGSGASASTKQETAVTSLSIPRGQGFLLVHHPSDAFIYSDRKRCIQIVSDTVRSGL